MTKSTLAIFSKQGIRCTTTMFPLVAAKQSSGLSARQFCAEYDLPEHVFYYWQRKYREKQESPSGFVQVEVSGVENGKIRMNLCHGRSLDFNGPVSARWLGELIRELD